jgi:hypothetical protein
MATGSGSVRPAGEVLRLRNSTMIENIRSREDPAWRERVEWQQVQTRLGPLFGDSANPLELMLEHARQLNEALPEPDR